jgi:hypothetical protein
MITPTGSPILSAGAALDGATAGDESAGPPVLPAAGRAVAAEVGNAHAASAAYSFPARKQRRGALSAPLTAFLAVAACAVCGDQFVPQPGVLCCERHRPRHVA